MYVHNGYIVGSLLLNIIDQKNCGIIYMYMHM